MNTTIRRILATGSLPILAGLATIALFLHSGEEARAKGHHSPEAGLHPRTDSLQGPHRNVEIERQTTFSREAVPKDAPSVLLLHGCRLTAEHSDRVDVLLIQNGNAYDEGLRDFLKR